MILVKCLLSFKEMNVKYCNYAGVSPLHMASHYLFQFIADKNSSDMQSHIIATVLNDERIAVNILTVKGQTLVHQIIEKQNKKHKYLASLIATLLKHPDLDINATDTQHNTALHLAIDNSYMDVIKSLLEPKNINVHITGTTGHYI